MTETENVVSALLRWQGLALVMLAVALVDQTTKAIVRVTLDPGEQTDLLGRLTVHHVHNPGIAGGDLQGGAIPLAILAIAAVAWIHAYLARRRGSRPWLVLGFGLLLGGGIGNLVDRLRLGWVTDFIRQDDRAYNLADVAIFAGGVIVLAVLIWSFRDGRRPSASDRADYPTRSGA
ncbi:signal peptidase II [soil metagenome]